MNDELRQLHRAACEALWKQYPYKLMDNIAQLKARIYEYSDYIVRLKQDVEWAEEYVAERKAQDEAEGKRVLL